MHKQLLTISEVPAMIRNCYESDVEHILNVHVSGSEGLEYCIYRTVADLISFNADVYSISIDNKFIGYFGEESVGSDKWLTGFFIMPESRKSLKKEFFAIIKDHFNGNFKSGVYSKNEPAKKFLINNGCQFVENVNNIGSVFLYKESV